MRLNPFSLSFTCHVTTFSPPINILITIIVVLYLYCLIATPITVNNAPSSFTRYVVCEPLGAGLYKVNEMSCGDLYWSAEVRTCVREIPASATCDREATALPTDVTTTEYPC